MPVISRERARQIALSLFSTQKKKIEDLESDMNDLLVKEYESLIPPAVMESFKKHPDWIQSDSQSWLSCPGIGRSLKVNFKKQLPQPASSRVGNKTIRKPAADKIQEMDRALSKLRETYKKNISEAEETMVALKTYNKITEQLPEAKKFLQDPTKLAIVVNADKVRRAIKEQ